MERHRNNIGVLRLLFALLVIVGHAPELIDGSRMRDPFTHVFHALSLGEVSVDAFFLLSGYLITQSMTRSSSLGEYLKRRVLRIYPAFVLAWLVTVYAAGPLVGGHPASPGVRPLLGITVLAIPPRLPGALSGLPYPLLNGAMWTIQYEFACYLMIAALGILGFLQRRGTIVVATSVVTVAYLANHCGIGPQQGAVHEAIRFTCIFLMGSLFFLFRDAIFSHLTGGIALLAACVASVLMFHDGRFAELALMTFGATALFWVAFRASLGRLQRVNDDWDISYGVYLYGWPIEILILWHARGISPWALAALALPCAVLAGAASWWGLEKWTKDLFRAPSRSARLALAESQGVPVA